jgi:Tfp pilus assembly protein PilF
MQQCNLGIIYFEMMQNDLAMDYFRKSYEILPEYIRTNIYIAKIKLRHNKIKEAKEIVEDKLKKYRSDPELLELFSIILLKNGQINAAQYFAKKRLAQDADSLTALAIMAETCRIKSNYAGAISYWKSVRLLSPQNALANLALIELYAKIKDTKMLDQEIRFLFYLQGSLKLDEYIKKLTKDENLIIYVPKIENYSFIRQCSYIN